MVKQCFKFLKYYDDFIKFSCVSRWSENLSFSAVNSHVYDALGWNCACTGIWFA